MLTVVNLASILPDGYDYPLPRLPYCDVWQYYADAGLHPVPVHDAPPKGFQSWSRLKAEQWAISDHWSRAQTALHIPAGLVVLDDDYPERCAALEAELGVRPVTLYSTSRGADSPRRKSLYRVPEDARFGSHYSTAEGVAGDVIDNLHRFMFACPTVNRRTGDLEEWYAPDGTPLERFPTADDLAGMVAELPEAWVLRLSAGAPADGPVRPYDGPTRFRAGELSERVEAVVDRHPDTSHYPEMNSALYDLAWSAVRFPEAEGIDTARSMIAEAYVLRSDTRKPVAQRQAAADRAWESSIAKQAARFDDDLTWESIPKDDPRSEWAEARAQQLDTLTPYERQWAGVAPTPQPKPAEPIPESWVPRDVAPYLEDGYEPPRPDVLRRSDGRGLFYRGAVNEVHGAAGDGKTRLALAAVAEALGNGERVLYLNYEEPDGRLLTNLRQMGADPQAIREHFDHLRPEERPTDAALRYLTARGYALVVVDTVGESIQNVTGGDSNSTDDVTVWHRFARAFANAGACVLALDHITKAAADEGGSRALMPIGSQAKYAGYKGAVMFLEPSRAGGLRKGAQGALRLILAKDNGGGLELAKGELAGTFHVDSRDPMLSEWHVSAPLTREEQAEQAEAETSAAEWTKGRQILAALAETAEPVTKGELRRSLGYIGNHMRAHEKAFSALVQSGAVVLSDGPRSSTLVGLPAPSPSAALKGMRESGDSAAPPSPQNAAIPSRGRSGEGGDSRRVTLPPTLPVKSPQNSPSTLSEDEPNESVTIKADPSTWETVADVPSLDDYLTALSHTPTHNER